MSVSKYQMFLKTVECGSFSRAAEELNFTQSGVSHAVQALGGHVHPQSPQQDGVLDLVGVGQGVQGGAAGEGGAGRGRQQQPLGSTHF